MRAYPFVHIIGMIITALAGMLLFLHLIGPLQVNVMGLNLEAALIPALSGETRIDLPPIGAIRAKTHHTPIRLELTLQSVEATTLVRTVTSSSQPQKLAGMFRSALEDARWRFAARQTGAAALGALVVVMLVWRRVKAALWASVAAGLVMVCMLMLTASQYRVEAFREPQYQGAISLAPDVLRIANDSLDKLARVQGETEDLAANLQSFLSNLDSIAASGAESVPAAGSAISILLVSDLHANPLGIRLIQTLAERFHTQLILNAGDLTDFGTPLEAEVLDGLRSAKVPQLIAPGNHDKVPELEALRSIANLRVLNGQTVRAQGLAILGIADVLTGSPEVALPKKSWRSEMEKSAAAVKTQLTGQPKPDIIVAHNPTEAKMLAGYAPLIVTGHTHKESLAILNGSVIVNPGTIGAAGLRGLYSEKEAVYSAAIVQFLPGTGPVSVDFIRYDPGTGSFSLERRLVRLDGRLDRQEGKSSAVLIP